MSGISRAAGYAAGAGKEGAALAIVESFLASHFRTQVARIHDADENYKHGDFRLPGGSTVECKGQPIDPERYALNFVEVCEDTSRGRLERHVGGFSAVATAVGLSEAALAAVIVTPKKAHLPPKGPFGQPAFLSASIHTFVNASAVVYANCEARIIALYDSKVLLRQVRDAMLSRGMVRGAGHSNDDTFSVFVPYPPSVWRGTAGGFVFAGTGEAGAAEAVACKILGIKRQA